MPPGTDLSYSWSQAASDLGQIAPIVALVGFFLLAVVTDLVLPRSRRGGVTAMFAVVGFAYSLGTALYRWLYASGGYAYHRFATGDTSPRTDWSFPSSRSTSRPARSKGRPRSSPAGSSWRTARRSSPTAPGC